MALPEDKEQLVAGLRRWAQGSLARIAAVELLIEADQYTLSHLLDAPAVRACLVSDAGWKRDDPLVSVRWEPLITLGRDVLEHRAELPARSAQVCLIAAELVYQPLPTGYAMTVLLSGLDTTHTRLVVRALLRHQGHRVPADPTACPMDGVL